MKSKKDKEPIRVDGETKDEFFDRLVNEKGYDREYLEEHHRALKLLFRDAIIKHLSKNDSI